jgi:hypothetical protein
MYRKTRNLNFEHYLSALHTRDSFRSVLQDKAFVKTLQKAKDNKDTEAAHKVLIAARSVFKGKIKSNIYGSTYNKKTFDSAIHLLSSDYKTAGFAVAAWNNAARNC